ncbi:MAG: LysR family transcriptional regulator [Deltaproteobacteria bacterium]|nr:LysR family transcriptional regulator [Deltaproteobacteria bacterium]
MAARKPLVEAPSVKRVRDLWAWIPAFKAVAESEHLPTAAARLHVSASALSRTVRLLEDAVGQPLFVRAGRRISLNAAGRKLLLAVQRATITLEQALPQVLGEVHEGELRIGSLGVLTDRFVVPAALDLAAKHPGVVPALTTLQSREANRQIAAGELDVAFFYDPTVHEGVRCRRLGALGNAVYCGQGHPLFGARDVPAERILEHPFSVAAVGDRGTRMDGFPVETKRRIGFQITMLSSNEVVALSGRYVCVLPEVVAAPHVAAGRLFRLDGLPQPPTEVFAATAEQSEGQALTEALVADVARRLAPPRRARR